MASAEAVMEAPRSRGLKRVFGLLLKSVVAVFAGVTVAVVAGAALPSLFGFRPMVVTSGSMSPEINPGDVVLLKDIADDRVAAGDVVTFRQRDGDGMTTHRVMSVKEMPDGTSWLQTQGDANPSPDANLTPVDAVHGEVRMHIPRIGPLLLAASTPEGKMVLLGVPALLLALSEIGGFGSALRHRRARRAAQEAGPPPAADPEPVSRPAPAASTFAFTSSRRPRTGRPKQETTPPPVRQPDIRPAMVPTTLYLPSAEDPAGLATAPRLVIRPAMLPTTFAPSAPGRAQALAPAVSASSS